MLVNIYELVTTKTCRNYDWLLKFQLHKSKTESAPLLQKRNWCSLGSETRFKEQPVKSRYSWNDLLHGFIKKIPPEMKVTPRYTLFTLFILYETALHCWNISMYKYCLYVLFTLLELQLSCWVKCGVMDWTGVGDTPYTVMTTGAPTVL